MKQRCDWPLLGAVIGLVGIGLVMIFSTSSIIGRASYDDSYFFIKRHLIYLVLGLIVCRLGYVFPHQKYQKLAIFGYIAGLVLMMAVFIPGFGITVSGATRWISVAGIRIQPIEIMKLAMVVLAAHYFENKSQKMHLFGQGTVPLLVLLALPILLLLKQPDLGNTLVLTATIGTLWIISGVPWSHFFSMAGLGLAGLVGVISVNPYQQARIQTFLDPWSDPLGKGYHITQSFMAIGSGGLWGAGLGQGKLKYYYLPLQYSDFIFSILCEEGGLVLASLCLLLFLTFFIRIIAIARSVKTAFSRYLALGLMGLILFQAFLNIGGVIGLVPVSGIPLPFISFGGTSLVISLFMTGVLLNISKPIYHKTDDDHDTQQLNAA